MKRRLFTILSALTLLLCVAVCAVWFRSYRSHDLIVGAVQGHHYHASSVHEKLWIFKHRSGRWWPSFRVDRYPAAPTAREGREARWDLSDSGRAVFAAEDSLDAIRQFIKDGKVEWQPRVPGAERELLDALGERMRAWMRWQAASAPAKGASRFGFRWHGGDPQSSPFLALPYWALFVPSASFPVARVAIRRWHVRRRARAGRCAECGYDLRATPGRCPECGTLPLKASA